jgi:hypothetical protein
MTRQPGMQLVERAACKVDLAQDRSRLLRQQPASLGEYHSSTMSNEKVLAQLELQQPDLPAQGRLRDVQQGSRGAEAPALLHTKEVFQLLEIHGQTRFVDPRHPIAPDILVQRPLLRKRRVAAAKFNRRAADGASGAACLPQR